MSDVFSWTGRLTPYNQSIKENIRHFQIMIILKAPHTVLRKCMKVFSLFCVGMGSIYNKLYFARFEVISSSFKSNEKWVSGSRPNAFFIFSELPCMKSHNSVIKIFTCLRKPFFDCHHNYETQRWRWTSNTRPNVTRQRVSSCVTSAEQDDDPDVTEIWDSEIAVEERIFYF